MLNPGESLAQTLFGGLSLSPQVGKHATVMMGNGPAVVLVTPDASLVKLSGLVKPTLKDKTVRQIVARLRILLVR
jgi:hypothetical protein